MPSCRPRRSLVAALIVTSALLLAAACAGPLQRASPRFDGAPGAGGTGGNDAATQGQGAGPLTSASGVAAPPRAETWPPDVRISAEPKSVYVEVRDGQSRLNFDFALENPSRGALVVREVELSVLDARQKLVLRKFINGNGFRPAIQTLASVDLPPGGALTVFNPFVDFPPEVALHELRYRFTLTDAAGERETVVDAVVHPTRYASKHALKLPLRGRILVDDGHDFYAHHRRIDVRHPAAKQFKISANFARFSYDFCSVDEDGRLYRSDGARNEDWYGFGASVYAPAGGTVVAAADGTRDNVRGDAPRFQPDDLLRNPMSFAGNHIVIDHGDGEYSLFAHLKEGSLTVRAGDKINAGQPIAKIGASGDASMPHLHYELRSGPGRDSDGLPSSFDGFRRLLGSTSVDIKRGQVDSGDFLQTL